MCCCCYCCCVYVFLSHSCIHLHCRKIIMSLWMFFCHLNPKAVCNAWMRWCERVCSFFFCCCLTEFSSFLWDVFPFKTRCLNTKRISYIHWVVRFFHRVCVGGFSGKYLAICTTISYFRPNLCSFQSHFVFDGAVSLMFFSFLLRFLPVSFFFLFCPKLYFKFNVLL